MQTCNHKYADWSRKTLSEIQVAAKYQINAVLRRVARRVYAKSTHPWTCQHCGYDKHVEICHIRAIKDFPPDALVSEVSGIENLVALCPNCHWEFDNGLLTFGNKTTTRA